MLGYNLVNLWYVSIASWDIWCPIWCPGDFWPESAPPPTTTTTTNPPPPPPPPPPPTPPPPHHHHHHHHQPPPPPPPLDIHETKQVSMRSKWLYKWFNYRLNLALLPLLQMQLCIANGDGARYWTTIATCNSVLQQFHEQLSVMNRITRPISLINILEARVK